MRATIVVTATDTHIGKTVFCAGLTRLLDGLNWKPAQAGLEGEANPGRWLSPSLHQQTRRQTRLAKALNET